MVDEQAESPHAASRGIVMLRIICGVVRLWRFCFVVIRKEANSFLSHAWQFRVKKQMPLHPKLQCRRTKLGNSSEFRHYAFTQNHSKKNIVIFLIHTTTGAPERFEATYACSHSP